MADAIWAIGLMTGTVLDGNIDIALIRTDGESIAQFGPYALAPYPMPVQALLEEAGIATKITNRETWRRGSKRDYSYTSDTRRAQWPTLWVLDMERYALARQMLKERDIAFESTRRDEAADGPEAPGKSAANRARARSSTRRRWPRK